MSDEAIAGDTGDGGFGVEHAASEVASRRAKPAADIEVAYDKRNAPELSRPGRPARTWSAIASERAILPTSRRAARSRS